MSNNGSWAAGDTVPQGNFFPDRKKYPTAQPWCKYQKNPSKHSSPPPVVYL